jgi:4-hydroxy-3-methylbut-2-enyl diphosphate reductase
MHVEIDERSGFCFGVQNAVEIAEKAVQNGEKVYSLGAIVHNDREVERLSSLGLETINYEQFSRLKDCKVLIRAHGEPPETYRIAVRNNITIIEATCPIVKRLQSRIKGLWHDIKSNNGQIVIFGKPGHAEVVGLLGQTNNEGIIASDTDDIQKIDMSRPVYLFSQTTMSVRKYNDFAKLIRTRMNETGNDPDNLLFVQRSICGQVSNREPHLKSFACRHDVIVFVSGKESSNGKILYSICREVNENTFFISDPDEIKAEWFTGKKSAGVCGATSTPKWLIEAVRNRISEIA